MGTASSIMSNEEIMLELEINELEKLLEEKKEKLKKIRSDRLHEQVIICNEKS